MSAFWQAKIWGLLHNPVFKALHDNEGRDGSFWLDLEVMQAWRDNGWNLESDSTILKHIHLADDIASASDRGAIGSISQNVSYAPSHNRDRGLQISHLLSGAKLDLKIKQHDELISDRLSYLQQKEKTLFQAIPAEAQTDIKRLFWWLWRCLPEAACSEFQDESLLLMPAETCLPDSSVWSHASLNAALAGALAGFNLTTAEIEGWSSSQMPLSHPYLATFSFSPVQELIKASRKMRDFWAGSWILHYLSAKISWRLAQQYGPDTLLYPSLYQQPLIDQWLRRKWPEFGNWVKEPSDRALLTAGFPNVLVLVLPKDKVPAAMQTAQQTLLEVWRDLGNRVFQELHTKTNPQWMPDLQPDSSSWEGWLQSQWQTYWTALPIGKEGERLQNTDVPKERQDKFQPWLDAQNQAYSLVSKQQKLFQPAEIDFIREAYRQCLEKQGRFSVNVGSWWPHIFDQTRFALSSAKNARNWQLPTVFCHRSTVSGLGPVVHPGNDWAMEGAKEVDLKKHWQRRPGLFDGIEQLNAVETVKRGLHAILPELLNLSREQIAASYPDLTSGVSGYLKQGDSRLNHFRRACQAVQNQLIKDKKVIPDAITKKWGIPWIDEHKDSKFKQYHPRLLNPGWLVEDLNVPKNLRNDYRAELETTLNHYYPSNNPTDWYVLAAGDGDGMSEWLKGKKLKNYGDYIPSDLSPTEGQETFEKFLNLQKRMGPSTHNAFSRALLDFSNQLVPYLTERRYAGRLIYSGGDDVLAYTNLWEWDRWLWDIRQCFRGAEDREKLEFDNKGDYWRWQNGELPKDSSGKPLLSSRPLFTMGHTATISFGITIAHQSIPLAITLENLWEAEKKAKEHEYHSSCRLKDQKECYVKKDAVQIRVLHANGNIFNSTGKFAAFYQWQQLIDANPRIESAIFEQAAATWRQHPVPTPAAILLWTKAFCARREQFQGDDTAREQFRQHLAEFLQTLWLTTLDNELAQEVQSWLKLAAFTIRNREIKLGRWP